MIRRHLILQAFVPAITAATLVVSGASAMPAQDAGLPARHAIRLHHSVPSPDRVDAAAHAAIIRGIGAALVERART